MINRQGEVYLYSIKYSFSIPSKLELFVFFWICQIQMQFNHKKSFDFTNLTFDKTRQFQTIYINCSIVQPSKLNLRQDFHKSSRVFFKNLISFWLFKKIRKIFHYALWKVAKKWTEWLKLRHLNCNKLECFT